MPKLDNTTLSLTLSTLETRLPQGWRLTRIRTHPEADAAEPDLSADLRAPDGNKTRFLIEVRKHLEPRDVRALAEQVGAYAGTSKAVPLIAAPFLTERTRQLLTEAELSYLDFTGNCRIVSSSPGLFIATTGLATNPRSAKRPLRSLKGPMAGSLVRALCDYFPPFGVRELASRVQANPGYVSRILDLLDREALITRRPRGPVEDVKWAELIRRWAQDYSPFSPERALAFLEPRGLNTLSDKFRKLRIRHAWTGSMAASRVAPIAPPRLAICYVDEPEAAAQAMHLQPAEVGANVMLVLPFGEAVYERTWERDGITFAALSQVAADLLHSPGRGPEEATALLEYMAKDEHAWRT